MKKADELSAVTSMIVDLVFDLPDAAEMRRLIEAEIDKLVTKGWNADDTEAVKEGVYAILAPLISERELR